MQSHDNIAGIICETRNGQEWIVDLIVVFDGVMTFFMLHKVCNIPQVGPIVSAVQG
mgnify:CR=1 FL=1